MGENNTRTNGNGRNIVAKLWLPKNDNIKPVLEQNIGPHLYQLYVDMNGRKCYRESVPYEDGWLEVHIKSAEGIASDVMGIVDTETGAMSPPDPTVVGITGSDFVFVNILDREKHHFHTMRRKAFLAKTTKDIWKMDGSSGVVYPVGSIFLEGLKLGEEIGFLSQEKQVAMEILRSYEDQQPFLTILGPNDTTYEKVIAARKAQGKPVKAVWEERFDVLARSFLDAEGVRLGFRYSPRAVPRSSEGYVRRGGEEEREDLADITVEVGRTYKTARANGLEKYKLIMQTYPVEVRCSVLGEEGRCHSLARILKGLDPNRYAQQTVEVAKSG